MFTIKLQTEPATVRQLQIERLAPRGFLPAMLHTTAQRITQAMATLHEYGLAWTRQLEGGGKRMQTLGFVESTRLTVGDVVHVGVRVGGQRLLWQCHNRRNGRDGILRGRRNGIWGTEGTESWVEGDGDTGVIAIIAFLLSSASILLGMKYLSAPSSISMWSQQYGVFPNLVSWRMMFSRWGF